MVFPNPEQRESRILGKRNVVNFPRSRVIEEVPYVPWDQFVGRYFRWKQGEHLAIIGPTGQGKTNLALNLLPLRRFVTVFATKPRDDVMALLKRRGYVTLKKWKPLNVTMYPRRILWPDATSLYSEKSQSEAFKLAFEKIYREGGWCLFLDEVWYMTNKLKFGNEIKTYLLQARSLQISLLLAAQRPAWIPVETFDQSTHLFFYRDNDQRNLSRIASIGSLDSATIRYHVERLGDYEALYVNSRNSKMYRTISPQIIG